MTLSFLSPPRERKDDGRQCFFDAKVGAATRVHVLKTLRAHKKDPAGDLIIIRGGWRNIS